MSEIRAGMYADRKTLLDGEPSQAASIDRI